jgi:ABC-type nitrate/sulfonate/bicarbonate transport system permease component
VAFELLPIKRTLAGTWQRGRWVLLGIIGSLMTLLLFWYAILLPLDWPAPSLVGQYFCESAKSIDIYKALLMTCFRSLISMMIGFSCALVFALLTGRTKLGWCIFFFLLIVLQKIPAIAMVHVFVQSKLGIGFLMTVSLASTVVMTFTWLVLHHRAQTLDARELFTLKVVGFKGWRLSLYGILPHMGSAIGGAARLAMSIAVVMVVLGEWQGVWEDGSLWQYGLGITISRNYGASDHSARVLADCLWLGLVGVITDGIINFMLYLSKYLTGVNFKR